MEFLDWFSAWLDALPDLEFATFLTVTVFVVIVVMRWLSGGE
jgi:hypothetical protein